LPERVCVLASGGLDSAVLLGTLARRHRVHPIYVRCGLVWERAEQRLLERFLGALRRRPGVHIAPLVHLMLPVAPLYGAAHWSISGRGVPGLRAGLPSNYLPGRNLLLASLRAVYCARERIPVVALGRLASRALGRPIAVRAPLRGLDKAAVIRRGRDLPLELTLSCARPHGVRHCGTCTKCAERRRALARAGLADPTAYASDGGRRR